MLANSAVRTINGSSGVNAFQQSLLLSASVLGPYFVRALLSKAGEKFTTTYLQHAFLSSALIDDHFDQAVLRLHFNSWEQARQAHNLRPAKAVALAGVRLVCWHFMQPLLYWYVLLAYKGHLSPILSALAMVVCVREVLYVFLNLMLICLKPQYLFFDVVKAWEFSFGEFLIFVIMPEKFVLFELIYRQSPGPGYQFPCNPLTAVRGRSRQVAEQVSMVTIFIADCSSVVGIVVGLQQGICLKTCASPHLPLPLLVAWIVPALSMMIGFPWAFLGLCESVLRDTPPHRCASAFFSRCCRCELHVSASIEHETILRPGEATEDYLCRRLIELPEGGVAAGGNWLRFGSNAKVRPDMKLLRVKGMNRELRNGWTVEAVLVAATDLQLPCLVFQDICGLYRWRYLRAERLLVHVATGKVLQTEGGKAAVVPRHPDSLFQTWRFEEDGTLVNLLQPSGRWMLDAVTPSEWLARECGLQENGRPVRVVPGDTCSPCWQRSVPTVTPRWHLEPPDPGAMGGLLVFDATGEVLRVGSQKTDLVFLCLYPS